MQTHNKVSLCWWQWSGKGIEKNWLLAAARDLEATVGRRLLCRPSPSPPLQYLAVSVKDWRNIAGIYWEGADLLGSCGQGSTNLLLLPGADLILECAASLFPAFTAVRIYTIGTRLWHSLLGYFISSLPPKICQCKQLPTSTQTESQICL